MASRIEITFTFDAPDDEMERARMLGAAAVGEAADGMLAALRNAGAEPVQTAKFLRSVPARSNSGRKPRLAAAE